MAKKPQPPPKNFEDALEELERILGAIEQGQVGLEESLAKYERGTFLIQHCRGVLQAAEKQIELLSKGPPAPAAAPATAPAAGAQEIGDERDLEEPSES
ncbi:MAG TPA: exodeoxyribonuclease VII small subunit [Tepidisphaeraceae bacterium]|jgi:exodeoxyribonuclease VII small subunit|nr:exodeoxyribonuclease VII small subunit [Tepidisphaeraceae bacterium]